VRCWFRFCREERSCLRGWCSSGSESSGQAAENWCTRLNRCCETVAREMRADEIRPSVPANEFVPDRKKAISQCDEKVLGLRDECRFPPTSETTTRDEHRGPARKCCSERTASWILAAFDDRPRRAGIIGAVVGLIVVAFILLTERFGARLYPAGGAAWRRVLIPTIGSLGMGYLLFRFFPDARGSGVPQTKAALYARESRISVKTILGKFFCTSAMLASGIPLGREGRGFSLF
jgi:hypothetical protein